MRWGHLLLRDAVHLISRLRRQLPLIGEAIGVHPVGAESRPYKLPRKKGTSIKISTAPSIDGSCSEATSIKFGTPVSGGAYQNAREVTIVWNDARKIGLCLKSDAECTPYP